MMNRNWTLGKPIKESEKPDASMRQPPLQTKSFYVTRYYCAAKDEVAVYKRADNGANSRPFGSMSERLYLDNIAVHIDQLIALIQYLASIDEFYSATIARTLCAGAGLPTCLYRDSKNPSGQSRFVMGHRMFDYLRPSIHVAVHHLGHSREFRFRGPWYQVPVQPLEAWRWQRTVIPAWHPVLNQAHKSCRRVPPEATQPYCRRCSIQCHRAASAVVHDLLVSVWKSKLPAYA